MKYKFEVTIEDGSSEFWDTSPTAMEVLEQIQEDLDRYVWQAKVKLLGVENGDGQIAMKFDE